MIVYSFAWRKKGDSPCNIRLALAAKKIAEAQSDTVVIVAQRTTAKILRSYGIACQSVTRQPGYEGSEEPTRQAANIFRQAGITKVIPIAQPCLQLTKCIGLIRKQGFATPSFWRLVRIIGWIGFDRQSVQPATRDPFRLVWYAGRQILCGCRPPVEQSEP